MKKHAILGLSLLVACGGGRKVCDPGNPQCGDREVCLLDRSEGEYRCVSSCDAAPEDSCPPGLVCEPILDQEGRSACVTKAYIAGRVFDLASGLPIPGALVMAQKTQDGSVTDVAMTGADGSYAVEVRVARSSALAPVTGDVYVVQVSARDHLPYPSPFRPAIPIALTRLDPKDAADPDSA